MVFGPSQKSDASGISIEGGWQYGYEAIRLIAKKNPRIYFDFHVAHLNEWGQLPSLDFEGNFKITVHCIEKIDLQVQFKNQASSQHGGLLNILMSNTKVESEFLGILDPDMYIFKENIVEHCIDLLRSSKYEHLGVSYPESYSKSYYWDFPTVYFQIFNAKPNLLSKLNFRPDEEKYVQNEKIPSSIGFRARSFMENNSGLARFKFFIFHRLLFACLRIIPTPSFIKIFANRVRFQDRKLFGDTGWFNRFNLIESDYLIFPSVVNWPSLPAFLCSKKSYLENNPDLAEAKVSIEGHLLFHGIFENRKLGGLNFFANLLRYLFVYDQVDSKNFPVNNIVSRENLIGGDLNLLKTFNDGKGYWYCIDNEVFCYHFGHAGKNGYSIDTNLIKELSANL
jgi:hypothetical protein